MGSKPPFVRFEVLVNGQRKCISGIDGYGVLTTIVSWGLADPKDVPPDDEVGPEDESVTLHVGGLHEKIHHRWLFEHLGPGDEISIRILGPGPADIAKVKHT